MTAEIGDMGPEAVYCFHMEPTCVLHLPGEFLSLFFCFFCCNMYTRGALTIETSSYSLYLSFVSKTNSET